MPEHVFLQEPRISADDLRRVLDLSAVGELEWGRAEGVTAIGSNVAYSLGEQEARACNLQEVRAGFLPDGSVSFNYLRFTDLSGRPYYIEDTPRDSNLYLAKQVLKVGLIAVRTNTGRLSGEIKPCDDCQRETGHIALYGAVHGIPGAVLAGSERTECVCCGAAVHLEQLQS